MQNNTDLAMPKKSIEVPLPEPRQAQPISTESSINYLWKKQPSPEKSNPLRKGVTSLPKYKT